MLSTWKDLDIFTITEGPVEILDSGDAQPWIIGVARRPPSRVEVCLIILHLD